MGVAQADKALYGIVTGAKPGSVSDVLEKMQQIDACLPDNDGLKWFNRLYMMVTEEVDLRPPAGGWKDAAWLDGLDVVFAGLYFDAVAAWISGASGAPHAWDALMQARFRGGIDRIQFALAGMNAHINHDLALALIAIDKQRGVNPGDSSPQHDDYESVNQLLATVMPHALNVLATGVLGQIAQDTGKIGRLLAFWNICKARDLAWDFSRHLQQIGGVQRVVALAAQDQVTGALGRAILVCV
ncbi:MAG: hypothetical protein JSS95_10925 [Acidobacteria bacterium]|nr:hypothetical protein [Acidobacteriota bacterium]